MMEMKNERLAKKTIHWALLFVAILEIITGFGITEFQLVEPLMFGLLTKTLAFQIHTNLSLLFIALLILHIYLTL